jgi:four helix bundle protein
VAEGHGIQRQNAVHSHRDLIVWQRAMDLAVEVYRLAARFPDSERYRLVSQITRAVASVPANIAERNARGTRKDYAQFVSIAKGSLNEAETFLLLAIRLGYLREADARNALETIAGVGKMLTALRKRLLTR